MADDIETPRLTGRVVDGDALDWQFGTEGGRNPVDEVLRWMDGGEGVGLDIMWPVLLAGTARITVTQAKELIAIAEAEGTENWIDRLRANWPPSPPA